MATRAQTAAGYRLRPAPRSRTRGRPASRIRWDKVGRVTLVIVFFLVLASYVGPALNFFDAWRDSRTEHAALGDLRQENAKLRERIATLDGSDAAERAARKQGLVATGEAAYTIQGLGH
jgi:cell division protein FtsB